MKQVLLLLLSFLLVTKGGAQILKKIGDRIKNDAAQRVSNKVDNEIRKGVDSIFEMPKKTKGKNNAKASTEEIDKSSTADNQPEKENASKNSNPSQSESPANDAATSAFIKISKNGKLVVEYKVQFPQAEITTYKSGKKDLVLKFSSDDNKYNLIVTVEKWVPSFISVSIAETDYYRLHIQLTTEGKGPVPFINLTSGFLRMLLPVGDETCSGNFGGHQRVAGMDDFWIEGGFTSIPFSTQEKEAPSKNSSRNKKESPANDAAKSTSIKIFKNDKLVVEYKAQFPQGGITTYKSGEKDMVLKLSSDDNTYNLIATIEKAATGSLSIGNADAGQVHIQLTTDGKGPVYFLTNLTEGTFKVSVTGESCSGSFTGIQKEAGLDDIKITGEFTSIPLMKQTSKY